MADVLWTVAMAVDVYLVVYRRFEAEALRKLEIYYITIITCIVAIPAIVFLFIHTPEKGPMYGSVTVSLNTSLLSLSILLADRESTVLVFNFSQMGSFPNPVLLRPYLVCRDCQLIRITLLVLTDAICAGF